MSASLHYCAGASAIAARVAGLLAAAALIGAIADVECAHAQEGGGLLRTVGKEVQDATSKAFARARARQELRGLWDKVAETTAAHVLAQSCGTKNEATTAKAAEDAANEELNKAIDAYNFEYSTSLKDALNEFKAAFQKASTLYRNPEASTEVRQAAHKLDEVRAKERNRVRDQLAHGEPISYRVAGECPEHYAGWGAPPAWQAISLPGWETDFYTAAGFDFNSTRTAVRVKGVSTEEVKYATGSLEGVVVYTGIPRVDLSFGANLQPIFQGTGETSEKFKGFPMFDESGVANGLYNASGTLGIDASLLQWQTVNSGPLVQYNVTRQDLNGTLGSDNGQLLYATTQQVRLGWYASAGLPNNILVGGSAYWGGYDYAQVSSTTGHGSNGWGFNGQVQMPFPAHPDWNLVFLGGYEDMCIPLDTPFYREEFSTSNFYFGLKMVWQGLIGGTGGAKPWSGFYLPNDGH